eukprot:TRINITY_DN2924_c0_g1_i1.p1 TRINITY_DN2924_c0_g1~~TRINITY_DN2924_c0_g1_i1.p1  ORF type:complete len:182 (+),score=90.31 TRINITY_DN2924_c0_g1_i1:10-555(+)
MDKGRKKVVYFEVEEVEKMDYSRLLLLGKRAGLVMERPAPSRKIKDYLRNYYDLNKDEIELLKSSLWKKKEKKKGIENEKESIIKDKGDKIKNELEEEQMKEMEEELERKEELERREREKLDRELRIENIGKDIDLIIKQQELDNQCNNNNSSSSSSSGSRDLLLTTEDAVSQIFGKRSHK